ncbi:MAG: diacylglycerol kinase family lipid kinase [Myxococcaceae bacterium]
MKTFLVVNPNSANGDTGKRWAELGAKVKQHLPDSEYAFTNAPMHAATLAREALGKGFKCVVAVGGDGTINEVTNGFFDNGKVIDPQAVLAVLPRGTGGDFRKTFGWDVDFTAALKRLTTEETRPFDVGKLEYVGLSGKNETRYFANICSFGVSGQVDHEVNRSSKMFGGKLSFMVGSVKALMKYSDRKVRFSLDGGPKEEALVTTLAVANGKYFGGGMKVAPDADVSDGTFNVTLWSGYGLKDFALKQGSIYSGEHVKWKGTRLMTCKAISAESDEEVLIDCDGEQPGRLPCTMTVLPAAIRLKV